MAKQPSPEPPALPWVDGSLLLISVTIAGIVAATWVYYDARTRGIDNPVLWAAVIAFLFLLYAVPGIVALVIYILMRGEKAANGTS